MIQVMAAAFGAVLCALAVRFTGSWWRLAGVATVVVLVASCAAG